MMPDMRKSTKLTITELVGMTRRGKYTFEMRLALPIKCKFAKHNSKDQHY